ncbi:MAG: protein-L-isoaspartate O-methyltransferase [Nanohaloarchaea archaeon SW_10_44_10]|nr:MAG: protein-L-isoaspartate O-methyltransferase [Nanohaloarchaea archaeon SW_10_44_10]
MECEKLVNRLKARDAINSKEVREAFLLVDRAIFVPDKYKMSAYEDRPLPIGQDSTISAPHIVAMNTELLEVEPENRVVEVGSGSGYQAAILAELAGEVIGVEINRDLVENSRKNIAEAGYENVEIVHGNGLDAVDGEFDRIIFSCGISLKRFKGARERLKDDGVVVAPVKEEGYQIVKKYSDGEITEHSRVVFVEYQEE